MIYCVEDDINIRELIVYTLETAGYSVTGFENAKTFWEALEQSGPELVLLDIMLPGESGTEVLKKLKSTSKYKKIPVIMVTAKAAEYDKVKGLELGADDYIAKPFGMMEMVARIKALLRRCEIMKDDENIIKLHNIEIDVKKYKAVIADKLVTLTRKEFELLKYLMKNPGIVLSRDQILEKIWGYDFMGETRTVDVHIQTLRQKLGCEGIHIETIRGIGYRISE